MADSRFQPLQDAGSFASSTGSFVTSDSFMEAFNAIPVPKVEVAVDYKIPKQIALAIEQSAIKKAKELDFASTLLLSIHAGMFFAMGCGFYTVVMAPPTHYGLQRFASGLAFSTGFVMVIICGAELFTSNVMMLMAWASKKITTLELLRNWTIVYIGNFIGSLIIAALQIWGRTHENNEGNIGKIALDIAQTKCSHEWGQCFVSGVLGNLMIAFAYWMCMGSRTVLDRFIVILLPVAAFVAIEVEHVVSNMYFIPLAIMIKTYGSPTFWGYMNTIASATPTQQAVVTVMNYTTVNGVTTGHHSNITYTVPFSYPDVWVGKMIYQNLIPTTIGNIIGVHVWVVMWYWYLYLRDADHVSRLQFKVGSMDVWASPPPPPRPKTKRHQKKKNQKEATVATPPPQTAPVDPIPATVPMGVDIFPTPDTTPLTSTPFDQMTSSAVIQF